MIDNPNCSDELLRERVEELELTLHWERECRALRNIDLVIIGAISGAMAVISIWWLVP